ncbi:hypothetical protein H4R20_005942 [Coemansia guatemalensis]|uniref:Uncharacterized protein n=1 Tax=Coemansia guatemalensis TaxID=2761395 RepID=A0A9W8HNQ0_9FUNG|nr:hypothetical protein H4R20_005942 [Coemansia guatemalensis]
MKSDANLGAETLHNPAVKPKSRSFSRAFSHNNNTRGSVKRKLQRLCQPKTAAVLEVIPYDPIDDIISMYTSIPEKNPYAMAREAEDLAHRFCLDMMRQDKIEEMKKREGMQPGRSCLKNPANHRGEHHDMRERHVHFSENVQVKFI